MKYRRIALTFGQIFFGYLLWVVIGSGDGITMGAVWPLTVAFLIMFMLPEDRLAGDLFVRVVEALKGSK